MQYTHFIQQSIHLFAPLKKELAYLDPGTGSFLLQLLLATALGGLFMVKTFWKRIKNFFIRLFTGQKPVEETQIVQPEDVKPNDEPK